MFCRMFSSCIIIHQCENSQHFQYSHKSFMPNIWGQNLDSVIYWIFPWKSHTHETDQEFLHAHHSRPIQVVFLGKVTAFNAVWYVCLWSGWQGNIQAGILDVMGLLLSQVTVHMSRNPFSLLLFHVWEQFSCSHLPSHMALKTVLLKLLLILVII